ncbi:hypothetical protein GCM10027290_05940 [Micromonospora sonneratiae]
MQRADARNRQARPLNLVIFDAAIPVDQRGASVGAHRVLRCQGQARNGRTERDTILRKQGHEHEQVDFSDRHGLNDSTKIILLIRGFGVRVPGGAPTSKALTW